MIKIAPVVVVQCNNIQRSLHFVSLCKKYLPIKRNVYLVFFQFRCFVSVINISERLKFYFSPKKINYLFITEHNKDEINVLLFCLFSVGVQ